MGNTYACAYCGLRFHRASELVDHFAREHPHLLPEDAENVAATARRLIGAGHALARLRHACAICGERFHFYTSIVLHVLTMHPGVAELEETRSLRKAYAMMKEMGLIASRRRSQKGRKRAINCRLYTNLEPAVEDAAAILLAKQKGRLATLAARDVARIVAPGQPQAASAAGRILRLWTRARRVLVDAEGRRWVCLQAVRGKIHLKRR